MIRIGRSELEREAVAGRKGVFEAKLKGFS